MKQRLRLAALCSTVMLLQGIESALVPRAGIRWLVAAAAGTGNITHRCPEGTDR